MDADMLQRLQAALGEAWVRQHGVTEEPERRGAFILQTPPDLLDTLVEVNVEISAADLVALVRAAQESDRLRAQLENSETEFDALARKVVRAQREMRGNGRTDERLRAAAYHLGLTDPTRTKHDWRAIADHYWRLRFGTPPDELGGPVEPMGKAEAIAAIEEAYGVDWSSLLDNWRKHGVKVNKNKDHPNWRNPKSENKTLYFPSK